MAEEKQTKASLPIDPRVLEVHLEDDGRMKAMLADEYVLIEMPYGSLRIPVGAIRRIEVARRLTPEVQSRIETLMTALASDEEEDWKTATDELVRLGEAACPALVRASRTPVLPLMLRAHDVLVRMQEESGDEPMELREYDVVETANCRFLGRLPAQYLTVSTAQFGPLQLQLSDTRTLQSLAFSRAEVEREEVMPKDVLPDPGNLSSYAQQIGQKFLFQVTGVAGGSVWGSDTYTSDSHLASASMHMGLIKPGEAGVVLVEIVTPPASFSGSTRNGITTSNYGPYGGAYTVSKPKKKFKIK